ncbi:hypothetical protein [Telmatospirillum sp.]|uniref:DUF7716 domain-containing protein n=1 Tax=Telmatospirillum sp. TaxID=2079197 RepID=UPI00283B9435|nr:hypothetical protein [Telmatospirillum sp.]MDR3435276.1 hypothetical protein [Telmatospirillum sp.]
MSKFISLADILLQKTSHEGWLYLPKKVWTLETEGVFVDLDDIPAGEEPTCRLP